MTVLSMKVMGSAVAGGEGSLIDVSYGLCKCICASSLAGRAGALEESEARTGGRAAAKWQGYSMAHRCAEL